MFTNIKCLFENQENESEFKQICEKLINHPFQSPWNISSENDFLDFYLSEVKEELPHFNQEESILPQFLDERTNNNVSEASESYEAELLILKESLMTLQDPHAIQEVRGIEILYSLPLNKVPQFCDTLKSALSKDEALALFVNAVLKMEKPLSLSVASAIVSNVLYPLGFNSSMNTSRNLLASILNFSEIYPKAIIDEVILPCLKKDYIESLHFETLMKMTKSNLPNEYISYLIKGVLDSASTTDNTFLILQGIIERKEELESNVKDTLAWKLKTWSANKRNSVKFTKLVISTLTIYGSELTDQFLLYTEIIEENQTIMKKAAENVLKKLKNS